MFDKKTLEAATDLETKTYDNNNEDFTKHSSRKRKEDKEKKIHLLQSTIKQKRRHQHRENIFLKTKINTCFPPDHKLHKTINKKYHQAKLQLHEQREVNKQNNHKKSIITKDKKEKISIVSPQVQLSIASWSDGRPSVSCDAKRIEIVFPRAQDATGRLTLSELSKLATTGSAFLGVTLRWRRRKLELMLYENHVTSQQTHSEWSEGNLTFSLTSHRNCFYHGYVKGQRSSFCAISSCDGLAGYIQTDEELLFIQPSPRRVLFPGDSDLQAHTLYTCEPRLKPTPQPDRQFETTGESKLSNFRIITRHISRRRRSAKQPKYLEVMVAVDQNVVDEIGTKEQTQDYVMVLMNIANTVYQHHTLGMDIKVVVVKIVFLTKRQVGNVSTDVFNAQNSLG
ncbi:A disintegrin and metalloproteinase with thrombospondin motifs 3 [Elysia marginata]|uniref:A disintegrin and metalloproteinase with thrombospondin motifs 3 n=1 Tax=Elysia marginata TaxID=1093978 RepID=A0AAV4EIC9_9GAST|nr:A disintegrin and metalloproteinase with thrombospondin motifs 3 [Elysia marginata]